MQDVTHLSRPTGFLECRTVRAETEPVWANRDTPMTCTVSCHPLVTNSLPGDCTTGRPAEESWFFSRVPNCWRLSLLPVLHVYKYLLLNIFMTKTLFICPLGSAITSHSSGPEDLLPFIFQKGWTNIYRLPRHKQMPTSEHSLEPRALILRPWHQNHQDALGSTDCWAPPQFPTQ